MERSDASKTPDQRPAGFSRREDEAVANVTERPNGPASKTESLDFPTRAPSLRDCFRFDLRAAAPWYGLIASWFLSPPFRAVASFRLAQYLDDRGFHTLARWILVRSRSMTGAEINLGARIGPRVRLSHPNGVVIGEGVVIEPDVTILQQVTIGGPGREIRTSGRRYPRIGRGVNIYAGARVLGPVSVGAGASIGANAVVRDDVPTGALAVGIPARMIDRPRGGDGTAGDDEESLA